MLSQKKIKLIQSLRQKKFRQKYNLFVVEGNKSIEEIQKSDLKIKEIFTTGNFSPKDAVVVDDKNFKKISNLQNPQGSLAVVEIPTNSEPLWNVNTIALDGIQDPGNLGTIIRTADWMGISQIIVSENTVDLYNPKVIQASMGSFTRVKVISLNLNDFLNQFEGEVYIADMEGLSIYTIEKQYPFALLMGNEGNGVQAHFKKKYTSISIPNHSKNQESESLNVSIATAIILSEFIGNPL